MEDSFIEIKAYKCPFCGYYNTNKKEIILHSNKCRNNPDYTQECLYCHNLERDFEIRIMFLNPKRHYCCYSGSCPYINHTDTELMKYIEKEKEKLRAYGIVENKHHELVWEAESEYEE